MNHSDQVFTYKEMAELERRRLVAASLRGTLSAVNSDLHIDKLLDFIVNQALPLLRADAAAVYRLNMNGELSIQSVVGLPLEYVKSANVSLGNIALIKQPLFCTNLTDFLNEPGLRSEQISAIDEIIKRYRSILSVPIEIRDESYGVLSLFFIKRHKLNDDELDLAIDFSIQAALAIDNARLRIRAQQDAVNQERNRLARELHDSVIQNLFSASLIAETLPKIIQRDPEKGHEGLSELQLLIRGAIAEMHSLLLELRPRDLEGARLDELLKQIAEAASGRLRKPIDFTCKGQNTMPVDVQLIFYRMAQEAINNIVKHAEANAISINLIREGDSPDDICNKAILTITDDGRGFIESTDISNQLGFSIMKESADSIGAKLSIKSQLNHGTTVQLIWKSQNKEKP